MSDGDDQAELTDAGEPQAVCSECGESHDDGACWDEDDEAVDAGGYEKGQKRPLDHGVKVRGKIKRGTETRDQDELLIEGRGENAAEAAADFEEALTEAEEREWADRLRALQPGEADGDE